MKIYWPKGEVLLGAPEWTETPYIVRDGVVGVGRPPYWVDSGDYRKKRQRTVDFVHQRARELGFMKPPKTQEQIAAEYAAMKLLVHQIVEVAASPEPDFDELAKLTAQALALETPC